MCGIAGIFDLSGAPVSPASVRAMARMLAHRGPDGEGYWCQGPIGLGHRRLSILDLSSRGANPMPSNDPRVRITYNGEVYNMAELRAELEARGYVFKSRTDTEVIVNLYLADGVHAIERLDGMFAFAIWDGRTGKLVLARDRFGVKPLYWCRIGTRVLFASEIKAFLADPAFKPDLDPIGLSQHLSFMNMLGSRTLFKGVELLQQGSILEVTAEGNSERRYWELEIVPDETMSDAEWVDLVEASFCAAVRRQLLSDVPVSTYLSGGLDTTAVASVAAEALPGINSFTCGFELPPSRDNLERHFDESKYAREMADYLGTHHHELRLGPEALPKVFAEVMWHLDEPRVGISYQVFCTARLIGRDVGNKVVLSGVGGDELFAGYPWRLERAAALSQERFARSYYKQCCRLLSDERKSRLLAPDLRSALNGYTPFEDFCDILNAGPTGPAVDRAMFFEFKSFLNGLLVVDDKLSMAHSVEARVPFLDNALVDLARRIPTGRKLRNGRGKEIFRRAMAHRLPREVVERRKQGFTPPDASWYRNDLRAFVRETLLFQNGLLRDLVDDLELKAILDEHMSGRADHRFLIWSLMSLQTWGEIFVAAAHEHRVPAVTP